MEVAINEIVKKYDVVVNQTTNRIVVTISPLGKRGFNGKSAYQSALDNGFLGTELEWLNSQKNIDGGLIF